MKNYLLAWTPPILWMSLIFYLSSQPSGLPSPIPDFIPHFIEYALLSWLLFRAIKLHTDSVRMITIFVLFISVAYAASDEIHQAFVPTRTPSIVDFLVDTTAAMITVIYGNIKLKINR